MNGYTMRKKNTLYKLADKKNLTWLSARAPLSGKGLFKYYIGLYPYLVDLQSRGVHI